MVDQVDEEQSSRVLIPLPGIGMLELPRKLFDQYLVPEAKQEWSRPKQLLTSEEVEKHTSVSAAFWMAQARERRVPHHKLGRFVRFDLDEILNHEPYRRPAIESFHFPPRRGR